MLKRTSCLKAKRDFALILDKGATLKTECFLLKVLPNNLKQNRFGFVVSRRVSGKAVERNKIKRRLRATVYKKTELLKNGFDFVFLANKNVLRKDFQQLNNIVENIFRQALCLKNQ